jgi:hypothetical protein
MKNRNLKLVISMVLVIAASCNEPETIVTNIVHSDGSVTRRIEMKNLENKFELSDLQVPFDSTWTIRDSLEIDTDGDTIWVKRAEKRFASVDEINITYQSDSGANREIKRHAEFRKRFKWFTTEYRFSEVIDKKMSYGYPVDNFLNQDELNWFYSPASLTDEKLNGADSLKFREFSDSVDKKIVKWYLKNLVSVWIGEFTWLTGDAGENEMSQEALKQREDEFAATIEKNSENFDSLWAEGALLREFIGDANAVRFKTEADSAAEWATDRFWVSFKDYTLRTIMPGKLTETNGFVDSSGILLWPVRSDFFLTEQYEMYSQSKVLNKWAWVISGIFVVFVGIGIIIRKKGKG